VGYPATGGDHYKGAAKSLSKLLLVDTKNDLGKKEDIDTNPTTASLFQQSAGKLGPISQPSFSFSSDISEGTSCFNSSNPSDYNGPLGISSARLSTGGARHNQGNRAVAHSTTTPSMAQLRARKIMNEAQKTKSCRSHCLPTSLTSESSDWEETSTDNSSNVDLETVTHVGHFIDSLQKRKQCVPQTSPTQVGISTPGFPAVIDSPQCHFRAEITTRYQSSLANARNAMAASPIAKSFTSVSDPTPCHAHFKGEKKLDVVLVDEKFSEENSPLERIESSPLDGSLCSTTSSLLLSTSPRNQVPEAKVAYGESKGTKLSTRGSQNIRKDVHYYAILAQIQKLVRSDNASLSLGKTLSDANKRGMSLDVVTEIYKQERFKASSREASCNNNKAVEKGKACKGSVHVANGDLAVQEEAYTDSPFLWSSSSTMEPEETQMNSNVKTSISGEIADDMMELSRLCDQAAALFNENLMVQKSHPRVTNDVETKLMGDNSFEKELGFVEDNQIKFKNSAGSDYPSGHFGGNIAAPLVQNFTASKRGVHGESFDSLTYDAVPNAGKRQPEAIADARRKGLPTIQSVELYEKECLANPDVSAASSVDESGNPMIHDSSHEVQGYFTQQIGTSPENDELCPPKVIEHENEFIIPGLNEVQLRQLKQLVEKAEEMREADLSPQVCIGGAIEQSLRYTGSSESSPAMSVNGRAHTAVVGYSQNLEEIDAFFSRFSIQKDGEPALKHPEETPLRKSESKEFSEVGISANHPNVSLMTGESNKETITSQYDRHVGMAKFQDDGAESVRNIGPVDEEATVEKERKLKPKYLSREGDNQLPKHLGLWKSPWQRNHGSDLFQPEPPAGIVPAGTFSRRNCGGVRRQCFLSPKKRLIGHTGYLNVDFYSLYEATVVQADEEDIDQAPWEYRDVGQRFLHEKSLESRNWFGSFELQRENDRVPNPVCRPKSLEVSVTKIPEPGEWSEDWFTTWKSRKDNPNNLVTFAQDEIVKTSENQYYAHSTKFNHESTPILQKVVVEIGSLCPVRVRGGERVSRIHPEFTSSLRQSRWRKKYLKGSLFPTD